MTTKRFTFDIKTKGNKAYTQWYDNKKPINSAETICNLLNELNEENKGLKKDLNKLDNSLYKLKIALRKIKHQSDIYLEMIE